MKRISALLLIVGHCLAGVGQDTHYWTQAFGTRAALLGGSVVGGTKDNTALYYNPSLLAFIDTASVSINANLYQFENIRIENAIGQRADFKSNRIATIPLLVTGMFKSKNNRWKIGYGFFAPVNFECKATARIDDKVQIVDDTESPGEEDFIGQKSVSSTLKEITLAIGVGYRAGERFAIGITPLFTLRTADYLQSTLSRFYLNNATRQLVTATVLQSANYYHVRVAARLGASYKWDKVEAGITFTTPSLGIMGNGTVAADITATQIKFKGTRQDIQANDRQEKLKSKYHAPFNASAGVNVYLGRKMLTVTAFYAGQEALYDILRAEPAAFVRPADLYPALGSENFMRVKTGATSVFNMVLGYEQPLNQKVTLVMSIRSNQSFYDPQLNTAVGIKPDITSWNIYHFSAGGTIQLGRSSISAGLLLSAGNDKARVQNGNLEQVEEDNFLQGATTITKARYSTIGLLLGYSFSFQKM